MNSSDHLKRIGFQPKHGPNTREAVEELEKLTGVRLPADYRSFLLEIGGGYLDDAVAPCTVPSPIGELNVVELNSADRVVMLLDSTITPRNMICIGIGHFGMTTCLSIAGLDHGQIYALDVEMRNYWDEETLSRLPDLDPSIKEFFRLRDAGELPERPWGYENSYHVADSFSDLLERLDTNYE